MIKSKEYIGKKFCSPKALIYCYDILEFDPQTKTVVKTGRIRPNPICRDDVGTKTPVWHGRTRIGNFDARNVDQRREGSFWEIIDESCDPSGCGDSHNVSGKTTSWARYQLLAKRINRDGTEHTSGELIEFDTSSFSIKDIQFLHFIPLA